MSIFIVLFLTSPFHGLLAERVEEHVTGERIVNDSSALQTVLAIPRGFIREIQKIMHYIPMALLVLVISFIPAANIVAPLLWILLGAWMMSLQFVDYPMDNHRLPFSEVRDACSATINIDYLRRRRGLCFWTTHPQSDSYSSSRCRCDSALV